MPLQTPSGSSPPDELDRRRSQQRAARSCAGDERTGGLGSARLFPDRARSNDSGFTLIELLVVVVILGVLIAIAIPLYLNYRKGANDTAAESDLRNAISVLEQCNADNSKYPTVAAAQTIGPGGAATITDTNNPPCTKVINLSAGTSLTYTGGGAGYLITASNAKGTPKTFCYNSTVGGAVRPVASC